MQPQELEYIREMLKLANKNGLLTEVVAHALEAIQNNSQLTAGKAIAEACYEWDIA